MDRRRPTGAPAHIGVSDVQRLEAGTQDLRAVEYQHGGGSRHRAVLARLPRARAMLGATMSVRLTRRLDTAVADLHSLAGWTLFDNGSAAEALRHFGSAVDLANHAGDKAMTANIRYRIGRVHLHDDSPARALAEFERGRQAAKGTPNRLVTAILSANAAWAAAFFTEVDVAGMIGSVCTDLARSVDPAYARRAVPALETAIGGYGKGMSRSRAFCLISLAVNHLLLHDVDQAVDAGRDALDHGRTVRSARLRDRLRPLESEARRWSGAGELTERIRTMLPAAS